MSKIMENPMNDTRDAAIRECGITPNGDVELSMSETGFTDRADHIWTTAFNAGLAAAQAAIDAAKVTPRDYIEDFADEDNGDYFHICELCGESFRGHKRRGFPCKVCHLKQLESWMVKLNQNPEIKAGANAMEAK